jgi:DNA-binding response OmpR family regulator
MAHILVIEDDLAFREPLLKMLTNDGHEVVVASDGIEALNLLKSIRPDLIITDVMMPNLDGIETITEMSRLGGTTPIIVMSGSRRAITTEFDWASAPMTAVQVTLMKPFAFADLRAAIKLLLAGAPAAAN